MCDLVTYCFSFLLFATSIRKSRAVLCLVASVMSNSLQCGGLPPAMLLCPWDSSGKNTGVGCHFLLQCMKVKRESEVAKSCPTPSDPMDCSLPGSSIHGIFQSRVLEWVVTNTFIWAGVIIFVSQKRKQRFWVTEWLLLKEIWLVRVREMIQSSVLNPNSCAF